MQEYSTPQVLDVADDTSLVDAVFTHADNGPDDVVFTLGAGDITTLGPRIVAGPAGSGTGS